MIENAYQKVLAALTGCSTLDQALDEHRKVLGTVAREHDRQLRSGGRQPKAEPPIPATAHRDLYEALSGGPAGGHLPADSHERLAKALAGATGRGAAR